MRYLISLAILTVLLAAFCAAPSSAEDGYRFFRDGKEITPEHYPLHGRAGEFREGDAIHVTCMGSSGMKLVLGSPGEYRFLDHGRTEGRLLREMPDGTKRVVGVVIRAWVKKGETVFQNPLADLSAAERQWVRGVCIDTAFDDAHALLTTLDLDRTALQLCRWAQPGDKDSRLPVFPAKTRYLFAYMPWANNDLPWAELGEIEGLELLSITVSPYRAPDWSWIGKLQNLRYLRLWDNMGGRAFSGIGKLADVKGLSTLVLRQGRTGPVELGFVKALPNLRHLGLERTGVTDLRCLQDHGALERVDAARTPLARLPEGKMPALKRFDAKRTPVSADTIKAFRAANPGCELLVDPPRAKPSPGKVPGVKSGPEPPPLPAWVQETIDAMPTADRVDVRPVRSDEVLTKETAADEIRALLDGLSLKNLKFNGMFDVETLGMIDVRFFKGERLIGIVNVVNHGKLIRLRDGSGKSVLAGLPDENRRALGAWMTRHGVGGNIGGEWKYYKR